MVVKRNIDEKKFIELYSKIITLKNLIYVCKKTINDLDNKIIEYQYIIEQKQENKGDENGKYKRK